MTIRAAVLTRPREPLQVMKVELVSATFDFGSINDALEYCAAERGARAVVVP